MESEKSISMQKCREQRQRGMKQLGVNSRELQAVCCCWSIKCEKERKGFFSCIPHHTTEVARHSLTTLLLLCGRDCCHLLVQSHAVLFWRWGQGRFLSLCYYKLFFCNEVLGSLLGQDELWNFFFQPWLSAQVSALQVFSQPQPEELGQVCCLTGSTLYQGQSGERDSSWVYCCNPQLLPRCFCLCMDV